MKLQQIMLRGRANSCGYRTLPHCKTKKGIKDFVEANFIKYLELEDGLLESTTAVRLEAVTKKYCMTCL